MTWPPREGELWMSMECWPGGDGKPAINGGDMLVILPGGAPQHDRDTLTYWWYGRVLAPGGPRLIKAAHGDLIPGDDPRIRCNPTAGVV